MRSAHPLRVASLLAVLSLSCAQQGGRGPEDAATELLEVHAAAYALWLGGGGGGAEAHLRAALSSPSASVRRIAAATLRRESPGTEALRSALLDERDPEVLMELAGAFAAGGNTDGEALRRITTHADPGVRAVAARAIAEVARSSRPFLEELLEDPAEQVRQQVVLAAAENSRLDWDGRLLQVLEWEYHESVRWAAAHALSRRGLESPGLRQVVSLFVGDRNFLVSSLAADALPLDTLTGDLVESYTVARDARRYWMDRRSSILALGRGCELGVLPSAFRSEVEAWLLDEAMHATSTGRPPLLRRSVLSALARSSPDALLPFVTSITRAGEPADILALLEGVPPGRAHPLLELTREMCARRASPMVQAAWWRAAVRARGDAAARDGIRSSSPRVRRAVLDAVDAIPTETLTRALEDADPRVVESAIGVALRGGTDLPLEAVVEILGAPRAGAHWRARLAAATLLSRGAAAACRHDPVVCRAASLDPSPSVRAELASLGSSPRRPLGFEKSLCRRADVRSLLDLAPYPYHPALCSLPSGLCRRERLRLEVSGVGSLVVELDLERAPHHGSAILALAERGMLAGTETSIVRGGDALGFVPEPGDGVVAGCELPAETSFQPIRHGTLFEPPRQAGGGAFAIALRPIPELERRVAVLGRVVVGNRLVDELAEGAAIERAMLLSRDALRSN